MTLPQARLFLAHLHQLTAWGGRPEERYIVNFRETFFKTFGKREVIHDPR